MSTISEKLDKANSIRDSIENKKKGLKLLDFLSCYSKKFCVDTGQGGNKMIATCGYSPCWLSDKITLLLKTTFGLAAAMQREEIKTLIAELGTLIGAETDES